MTIQKTHDRTIINVSREDSDPDIVELAHLINAGLAPLGLGATLSRTIGVWEGAVEQGIEVKLTIPLAEEWDEKGEQALHETLHRLRRALPTQRFFQVETEEIAMGEWDTTLGQYT